MVESVQKNIFMRNKSNDARTFSDNRASSSAAASSKRGSEIALSGAMRDLEHNIIVRYLFVSILVRTYMQAHIAGTHVD